jgi:hypothetical protein
MSNVSMFKIAQLERDVRRATLMLKEARRMAPINRKEAMRLNDEALALLDKMNQEADEAIALAKELRL